jgi:hypothetical protein
MVAALVRLHTHIQAHHLPVLNQGEIATLEEVYQRGVQSPRGHVRSQGSRNIFRIFVLQAAEQGSPVFDGGVAGVMKMMLPSSCSPQQLCPMCSGHVRFQPSSRSFCTT